ncbi:isoprenylcysteine carboxylmethyltransferase family protein [Anatilimnocola sp. NA78]|uniref:methyltransferase family protein n=1 Tax=Anatilimnocola sp. NA78 TaxID=3415683 RepID=UPI003CE4DAA8
MMNSATAPVTDVVSAPSWQRVVRRSLHSAMQIATKRRMGVTFVVFTALIVSDVVLWQSRPCNVLNLLDWGTLAGEALVLMGLLIRSWAAGTLHKADEITTSGPYGMVRNPLYIGSFLMMLGFSILLRDWLATWIVLGPILAMYLNKVRQEERFLARIFPHDWKAYETATPRFVPQFTAWPSLAGFSLKQWSSNREYQAVLASAVGLFAIWIWYAATA